MPEHHLPHEVSVGVRSRELSITSSRELMSPFQSCLSTSYGADRRPTLLARDRPSFPAPARRDRHARAPSAQPVPLCDPLLTWCFARYDEFSIIIGMSAHAPKIMCDAVMTRGKRRP